jgi:hypothetical protein
MVLPARSKFTFWNAPHPGQRMNLPGDCSGFGKKTALQLDMKVAAEKRGGLSDGNFFWQHFPTLDGLGPAGNNAHCSERDAKSGKDQEYVSIPSFVPKALLNTLAIHELIKQTQ